MKRKAFVVLGLMTLAAATVLAADIAQTACPVSGEPIDKTIFVDMQGQRVYFCCDKCPAKFKADPDTYFEKMAAAGVVPENVQTTCPVSGETLESKDIHSDYKGRRIYFCCAKCKPAFDKDPAKYLAKMDSAAPAAEHAPHGAEGPGTTN